MSGFLPGLVQRGAGLAVGGAESVVTAAPRGFASEAAPHSIEAAPQAIDVSPSAHGVRTDQAPRGPHLPAPPAALATETVIPAAKVDLVMPMPVAESPGHPGSLVSSVEGRATPGPVAPETPVGQGIVPASTVHAPEPASQPSPTAPREDVQFAETPSSVIVRLEHAQAASRVPAPASPRIEISSRAAAATSLPSSVTSQISDQTTAPPVTVLTAARPAPGVELHLPAKSTPAPEAPPIHVRIGKVEVRAPVPAPAAAPPAMKSAPAPRGFTAYRRLRTYRK